MFHHYPSFVVITFIIIIIQSVLMNSQAEITFDGSLGSALALKGPNYLIDANQGTVIGSNLFHSFGVFNLNNSENATFTGPNNVTNIIGRVTGGSLSNIDGTLISQIPNADLYLLNPAGFLLGSHARIDVNGSFYLSSADYLRFADGLRFEASRVTPPILTVVPVQAFGFFDKPAGNIIFDGFTNHGYATVEEGKTLAVIGGEQIRLTHSRLSAPKGQIQIISANAEGEVQRVDVTHNTLTQLGEVIIEGGSLLHTNAFSGKSGTIVIQGGQFFLQGASQIQTLGETGTGDIAIKTTGQSQITEDSQVRMVTTQGNSGQIVLQGERVVLSQGGKILSNSLGQGQGGDIVLTAQQLKILDKAVIRTSAVMSGKGGSVQATVYDAIDMNDGDIQAITFGEGDAGEIHLASNTLSLKNGANVNASSRSSGTGGHITINVIGTVKIEGYFINSDTGEINPSGIASSAFNQGQGGIINIFAPSLHLDNWGTLQTLTQGDGNAGNIIINVQDLRITDGGDIDASNEGTGVGKGGDIKIIATDSVLITALPGQDESQFVVKEGFLGGIYSIANNRGTGGNIELSTKQLSLRNGGVISAGSEGVGDAGHITLQIGSELNLDNAAILTRAQQAGGGNIQIKHPLKIHVNNSDITAQAKGLEPDDKGGNITIHNQDFFTLNTSRILASAIGGDGGNIQIASNHFLQSNDSIIDASSELGVAGKISINSPEVELSHIVVSPTSFLALAFSNKRCEALIREDLSSFFLKGLEIRQIAPDDYQTHHNPFPINKKAAQSVGWE